MRKRVHELQWLEAIKNRQGLNKEELKGYQRLLRGYQGEESFDKLCQAFLNKRVETIDDITVAFQSQVTQIDKIIFSGERVYIVDVKNYRGSYRYINHEWKVGQRILSTNIFEQLRRAVRIVRNIYTESGIQMNVQGVLVFINPESNVEIEAANFPEKVLKLTHIPAWLMKQEPSYMNYEKRNLLQNYEVEGYRTTRHCDEEQLHQMAKGIRCLNCDSFHMNETKHTMVCHCGRVEVKETAFVRTICEYGLICHDKQIRKADLRVFFGKQYNELYIRNILKKHFLINNRQGRATDYYNKGVPFELWFKGKLSYFKSIEKRAQW